MRGKIAKRRTYFLLPFGNILNEGTYDYLMAWEDFHQINANNILFVDDNIFGKLDDERSHHN